MKIKLIFAFLMLVPGLFFLSDKAEAATDAFKTNSQSASASLAGNWESGTLPISGDDVSFPAGVTASWDLAGVIPASFVSAGKVSLQTSLTTTGDFKVLGGVFDSGSNAISVGGSVALAGGASAFGVSSVNVTGGWTFSGGTADLSAATVSFTGSGQKTILSGGNHFGNMTVNGNYAGVQLADDYYGDGTVTVSNGDLSLGGKTMTLGDGLAVSGGNLDSAGGKLVFVGSLGKPFSLFGTGRYNSSSNASVRYAPVSGSVTIAPITYNDLELAGKAIFSLSGQTAVNGKLTIGADAALSLGGYDLSVPGGQIENFGRILGDNAIGVPVGSLSVTNADSSDITALASSSGTVSVLVEDKNGNRNGGSAENISGLTVTTMSGDKETYSLEETGAATGVFVTRPLVVHESAAVQGNGQIEVAQNDIIFVSYKDAYDPALTKLAEITVNALGGTQTGAPQIVSGPSLGDWSETTTSAGTTYAVHVGWTTDAPSSSSVAVTGGNLTAPIAAGSLDPATDHDVLVGGLLRGYAYSYKVSSMTADGKTAGSEAKQFTVILEGDRIKSAASPAVYWYLNGKRNVFSDFMTYDSWFPDFSNVVTVPAPELADIPLGKSVPMRAGTYLLKIQSDPRVYAVEPKGKLRWIQNEQQAASLYGANWSKRVVGMDVAYFAGYVYGDPLPDGKMPDGYLYKTGNETDIFSENSTHILPDAAVRLNGIDLRFVSVASPALLSGAMNGAVYFGYAPAVSTVFADGGKDVVAPARIE
jgi:hypothetical protein